MKKFYSLVVLATLIATTPVYSQVITAIKTSGKWRHTNSWNLGRLPQAGDTIVIPVGKEIELDNSQNLSSQKTVLQVIGILELHENGSLNLHANSIIQVFAGGILRSHHEADGDDVIKIGGVTKYKGNMSAIAGPSFANLTTASAPHGFTSGFVLPVKFTNISASRQGNGVQVQWTTSEERNSSHYEIERSLDASNWQKAGQVQAAGNSNRNISYSYFDRNNVEGVVYYRLRQVDLDGASYYTQVLTVKNGQPKASVKIFTSQSSQVNLQFGAAQQGKVLIHVFNMNGQVVDQASLNNPSGQVSIPVKNTQRGIYVVRVTDAAGQSTSGQVVL